MKETTTGARAPVPPPPPPSGCTNGRVRHDVYSSFARGSTCSSQATEIRISATKYAFAFINKPQGKFGNNKEVFTNFFTN